MQYTEELADQIIAEFCLNPTTKRVWKLRNAIPKKYLQKEGYHKPAPLSEAQLKQQKELIRFFSYDWVNSQGASKNLQYSTKITDVKQGKMNLAPADFEVIWAEINAVKTKTQSLLRDDRRFLDNWQKKFIDWIKNPLFFIKSMCLQNGLTTLQYNQIKAIMHQKRAPLATLQEVNALADFVQRIYAQLPKE